ncbi:MAG: RNA polymerase subunit sigma-70, partial [Planctomycetaceae bacterium]
IAAEHCLAPSFKETRWDRIVECYLLLEQTTNSPIHRLNRAIAVAEWQGAEAGLGVLDGFEPPGWLESSYQWFAVLSTLHTGAGNAEASLEYYKVACKLAPTDAVRDLLHRRWAGSNG